MLFSVLILCLLHWVGMFPAFMLDKGNSLGRTFLFGKSWLNTEYIRVVLWEITLLVYITVVVVSVLRFVREKIYPEVGDEFRHKLYGKTYSRH